MPLTMAKGATMEGLTTAQTALAAAFGVAAVTGLLASVAAGLTPGRLHWARRRRYWVIATVGFAVAGVLSILSIGVVFIAGSGLTAFAASRTQSAADERKPTTAS